MYQPGTFSALGKRGGPAPLFAVTRPRKLARNAAPPRTPTPAALEQNSRAASFRARFAVFLSTPCSASVGGVFTWGSFLDPRVPPPFLPRADGAFGAF